jgi:alcohol dehydrogenase class IV
MAANIRALRDRAPESASLVRYAEIAQILTGKSDARPEEGAEWVRIFVAQLAVPPLRTYGVTENHVPGLAEKASLASSMKANPLPLTMDELTWILRAAL